MFTSVSVTRNSKSRIKGDFSKKPKLDIQKRIIMSRDRSQWSDLPKELLEIIAGSLHTKTDVTRFRSVCKSWRFSVPPFQTRIVLPPKVPYMGPPHLRESSVFLTEATVYYLSPPAGSISSGSSLSGWLVKIKEGQQVGQQAHLMNPLSPVQIRPLPDSFPKVINSFQFRVFEFAKSYTLQSSNLSYKVGFSQDPDCPSLMLVASGVLWHLKLGQDRWAVIDDMISQLSYEDVIPIPCQGKFCAVDEFGRTVLIDSSLKITEIVSVNSIRGGDGDKKNLVVSNGELLLVDTYLRGDHTYIGGRKTFKVKKFRVFKLKLDQKRWVELQSLDDQILFMGEDCSFSVSAHNFDGCKGNCIVFTDPCFNVFNLDDGSVSPVALHEEYANIFNPPSSPRPNPSPHRNVARRRFFSFW